MRKNTQLLIARVLFGALLPVTAWGYGFSAYPGDGNPRYYAGAPAGEHHSGSLRMQTGMTADGYYIRILTGGLRPEDIHVSIQRNRLLLQIAHGSQYQRLQSNARGGSQWQLHFRRQLRLPFDADVTRMTTNVTNGIMEIHLPRVRPLNSR